LGISDIRYRGTIMAFDKDVADGGYTSSLRDVITSRLLSKQVYLRPLGNTVYLMPPYCLTAEQMEMVQNAVLNVLKELRKEGK
jgi:adenosylmethionine-8-amino-7-oxononanoate aminotransferase